MTLCQRNEISGRPKATAATDDHAGDQPDERARSGGAPREDGQHEHAENRPVEKRAEAIHDLDQRSETARINRHDAREDAPEPSRHLRDEEIVLVSRLRPSESLVEIDHARGRERVQLRRDRIGGGCDDRRDPQADDADRKRGGDPCGKDVVDVVVGRIPGRLP